MRRIAVAVGCAGALTLAACAGLGGTPVVPAADLPHLHASPNAPASPRGLSKCSARAGAWEK